MITAQVSSRKAGSNADGKRPVSRCGHPLAGGRTCVHIGDATRIGYEPCPSSRTYSPGSDNRCWHPFAKPKLHRHSHAWQHGVRHDETVPDDISRIVAEVRAEQATWTEADRRADARRALRLTLFKNALDSGDYDYAVPIRDPREISVDWYFHGASGWSYGKDREGHNYELSPAGKVKRIYSLNEQHQAVDYAQRFGPRRRPGSWTSRWKQSVHGSSAVSSNRR
jgi:hypothetical protein